MLCPIWTKLAGDTIFYFFLSCEVLGSSSNLKVNESSITHAWKAYALFFLLSLLVLFEPNLMFLTLWALLITNYQNSNLNLWWLISSIQCLILLKLDPWCFWMVQSTFEEWLVIGIMMRTGYWEHIDLYHCLGEYSNLIDWKACVKTD